MEYLDASNLTSEDLNALIIEKLKAYGEVALENPHSMHNLAIGLKEQGKIMVKGSTGFFTGGFLEGSTLTVEGNTGWYTGDNMMSGEIIVTKNTGCNAGVYLNGGTMVIYGGTGSRVGYAMKGGTIIVCGPAGRWAGQMTFGGKLILLGSVGKQVGESMYKGVIYTQDQAAKDNLGGNVYLDSISEAEIKELKELFEKYELNADPQNFSAIRPATTGRHTYVLFKPELKPELAKKYG
jgi:glutamate synthase domain-containing protein 3